jgi:mono/diheme cytochrome c family protein
LPFAQYRCRNTREHHIMNLRHLFSRTEAQTSDSSNLLDHPDIQRMTLRELADLPLPHPSRLEPCGAKTGKAAVCHATPDAAGGPNNTGAKLGLRALAGIALAMAFAGPSATAESSLQPRGQYLASIMDCGGCHTAGALAGKPDASRALAGGDVGFQIPGLGTFWPPNLTPDPETGLGNWSGEDIMRAVRTGARPDGRILAPVMPYHAYSALTDTDAAALASYLKSLKPIRNKVPEPAGPDAVLKAHTWL